MKFHSTYLLLATLVLLVAGCRAEELPQKEAGVPVVLTARVGGEDITRAGTAVQSTQFAAGETFRVHIPAGTSASSTTFTTSDGSGNTTCTGTQPYFNPGISSCQLHAYYPATVNQATTSFSVRQAQQSDGGYKESDLMYASATVTKSGPVATGSLTFTHRMVKIVLTVQPGSGVAAIQAIRIVGGMRTINIVTPLSCTLGTTLSDALSSDNAITLWTGTSTGSVSCAGVIPPQTIDGDFVQVVTNLGTATYRLDSRTFAAGSSYPFTLTVNAQDIGARNGYLSGGNQNWE